MKKLLLWISFFLVSVAAMAAQDSTIIVDNSPILLEPTKTAKVLEYLPLGAEVRVSSYPMPGGWYKVRAKNGVYGWIHEANLSVYKVSENALAADIKEDAEAAVPKPERDRRWFLRVLGGFDFFRPDDLNDLFGFKDLNTGYQVGGEFGVFLSERTALAFRAEALVKDLVARENISGIQFNLAARSYPVMGGLDFYLVKLPPMRLSFGIFGGIALGTSFSSVAGSLPQPNTMVLTSTPFTSLARLNLTRPLGRVLSVFLELGYRYLRTPEIETNEAQNIQGGPQIYAKNGVFKARIIDLSGVELGVGLGLHF